MNFHCRKRGNSLCVCFSYDKEEIVLSTGIKIADENWDKNKRKILQKSYNFFEDKISRKEAEIKGIITQLEASRETINLTNIRAKMLISHHPSRKTIVQRFDVYMYAKRTKVDWLTYMRSNQL
jgi:hypothetical protein